MDKIGFCAEYHKQDYRCANCGHEEEKTQMTNLYDHKIVKWENAVCSECGFKSLKPYDKWLEELANLNEI